MSTKLYTFKVPKQSVFTFSDSIRAHVLENWKPVFENGLFFEDRIKQTNFIQDHEERFEKDLQFFEITSSASGAYLKVKDVYLVRVLEAGYQVHNYLWGLKHPTCNYDDRADIPRRDRGNKAIAEEIDKLIDQRHYFIIPAVSVEDYLHIIWNTKAESEKVKDAKAQPTT